MTNWNLLIESHAKDFGPQDTLDILLAHDKVARMLAQSMPQNGTVLDYGCGAGRFVPTLRKYRTDIELHGYDASPTAVQLAETKYATVSQQLPSETFDAVVANFVLCCVPDMAECVQQMAKATRYGGTAIICDPNPDAMGFHFGSYHPERPKSFTDGAPYTTHLVGMEPFTDYWHPKSAYRSALQSAGFTAIEFREYLASSKDAGWKDEVFRAPYLHVVAKKW